MSRLPVPFGDGNTWGTVLNDYLSNGHNADGTTKNLFFNVKDPAYGAKGDGVTDDSAAITAAAAAASAVGGVVFFPPAIYGTTANFFFPAGNCTWLGYGATVKMVASQPEMLFVHTGTTFLGMTFDGGSGTATAQTVFVSAGSNNVKFRDCTFANSVTCLYIQGSDDLVVEDCTFTNWTQAAINGAMTGTTNSNRIRIQGCVIKNFTGNLSNISRTPIWLFSAGSGFFFDVDILNNIVLGPNKSFTDPATPGTADQIHFSSVVRGKMIGNTSMFGGDEGISITGCSDVIVANNTCMFNDTGGIDCDGTGGGVNAVSNLTVTGNLCLNNGQNRHSDRNNQQRTGIAMYVTSGTTVAGNTLGNEAGTTTTQYGLVASGNTNLTLGTNAYVAPVVANIFSNTGNLSSVQVSTAAFT